MINSFDFYNFDIIENKELYLRSTSTTGQYIITNSKYIPQKLYFLFVGSGCSSVCSYCAGNAYYFSSVGIRKPIFRDTKVIVKDILRLQSMGVDILYVEFDPKPFSEKFYNELFNELKSVRRKLELGLHFGVWAGRLPSEKMIESISNIFPREMA